MTTAISALTSRSRLFGAILLISGTAIGAAMLALPITTGRVGLVGSLLVMSCVWLYLLFAALFLLEIAISQPKNANLLSMLEDVLGKPGKAVGWVAYLFLLYALNTAYLSGMTSIVHDLFHISRELALVPLLGLFWFLLRKGAVWIDIANRLFMAAFALTFVWLIASVIPDVTMPDLTYFDRAFLLPSFAIVLCAFGYHIVIPSLVHYLQHDLGQIKKAIWVGSLIVLIVYVLWQIVTLGAIGNSDEMIQDIRVGFTFFAMITSFFGVSLALWDFLKDGCPKVANTGIFAIAFGPAIYFALECQGVFLKALEYAGAYGVVILLALLPALMVWRHRYVLKRESLYKAPGGRVFLIIFMAISVCLILIQIM